MPSDKAARSFSASWAWLIVLLLLPLIGWRAWQWQASTSARQICFVDGLTHQLIADSTLEVLLLQDEESPLRLQVDTTGCIVCPTRDTLKLLVRARYYRTDTLLRFYDERGPEQERVSLQPDDIARMIHYISHNQVTDWQKRREQLIAGFAPEARIFQLQSTDLRGMRMFTREEFVDRLSLPLNSLRNLEILETVYQQGRITRLTFIQTP